MYLMFLVKHPDTPIPTFKHLQALLSDPSPLDAGLVAAAMLAIALFAALHFMLLAWNLREFALYRQTEAYRKLLISNAEISLMAVPLTLGMSINVLFILEAVFVPGLWNVVESLFPFAILAFLLVGAYALRILGRYFVRLFVHAQFDFAENNSLSPMISIFALSMIAVGLAAPAAMSETHLTNAAGMIFSAFFAVAAALLLIVKLVLGFDAILRHGIQPQAAGSLWIVIPILTLLGITWVRWMNGLHHHFDRPLHPTDLFLFTSVVTSLQLLFGMMGYAVMKHLNYFADYAGGPKTNPGAFALICPGVAQFVFGMFFLSIGMVKASLIPQFSPLFFVLLAPLIFIQFKTIAVFFRLLGKMIFRRTAQLNPA